MELTIRKRERIVGIFILSTILCLVISLITIVKGQKWFKETVKYHSIFQESYNLKEGAPVKLFNAYVGEVNKIIPYQNNVKVTITIFKEYANRIRKDTVLTIESPTFIGEEYIAIKLGSKDSKIMPINSIVKSLPKKTLTNIMEEFEVEKTAKKIKDAIQTVTKLINSLNEPKNKVWEFTNNLRETSNSINRITQAIDNSEGSIGKLIKDDKLQKELIESINILKNILKNIESGSYNVPEITASTERGIDEIRNGVHNIDRAVKSLHKNFFIKGNLPKETGLENQKIKTEIR